MAFILPPSQPVVQVFESLLNLYFYTGLSWAWVSTGQVQFDEAYNHQSCLGIFIAHRVRDADDPQRLAEAEER